MTRLATFGTWSNNRPAYYLHSEERAAVYLEMPFNTDCLGLDRAEAKALHDGLALFLKDDIVTKPSGALTKAMNERDEARKWARRLYAGRYAAATYAMSKIREWRTAYDEVWARCTALETQLKEAKEAELYWEKSAKRWQELYREEKEWHGH